MNIITYKFRDIDFHFHPTPQAHELISEIFRDNYKVLESGIEFRDRDVILDIGACEGMFSIMMSKLFPQTRIIALEPVPRTFMKLKQNIKLNDCPNIEAYNLGAGKVRDKITISMGRNDYSGGSSSIMTFDDRYHIRVECDVMGLDEMWGEFGLDRVRLIKIDCEGAEYDILYNTHHLTNVDYLTGEFHMNEKLSYRGFRMDGLANWVGNRTQVICIEACKMSE